MTTNEAPEKIYLSNYSSGVTYNWHNERLAVNDIEYTRTDTFIEKACEFFGEHLWEYIDVKNVNCDTFINIDGDKLIEDFKKYMKGEYVMTVEEKFSKAVKLADAMYYAAQMLSTDASHLKKAMEDWWNFENVELNKKE